jgi:hypothetical protein
MVDDTMKDETCEARVDDCLWTENVKMWRIDVCSESAVSTTDNRAPIIKAST